MTKKEKIAQENFLKKEAFLSKYASKSEDAFRFVEEDEEEDIRPSYYRDIDRIIYSLSYTRYMDKTQVFTRNQNDHISKRITHVQMVSKVARTIGRALGLNEDLIEAIALGHDIGHTPLGHEGEALLNEISQRELGEYFAHNVQSFRHLNYVEKNGKGLNLCVQVLDGIICHNGEILSPVYKPQKKSAKEVLREYEEAYHDLAKANQNRPMTLEGCVVRISDVIGYIGRDIEDAIMIGKISRKELPENIVNVLGCRNKQIINTIILDIVNNSIGKPYIKMSDDVYQALFDLKKFNYEHIYKYSLTAEQKKKYREGMNHLFDRFLKDIQEENYESLIYKIFLDSQDEKYLKNTCDKRMVIDFLAGMTDEMFLREIEQ